MSSTRAGSSCKAFGSRRQGGRSRGSTASEVSQELATSIAIDPIHPETVYLIAYSKDVFKSTNGGQSWVKQNDLVDSGGGHYTLGIAPSAPSTIYVGHTVAALGAVTKTENGGVTWSDASRGLSAFDVHAIAFDGTGAMWVGGGYLGGVRKSTDGGQTYARLWTPNGIDWEGDFVVAHAPGTDSTVYAGVFGGLFKTTDGVTFEWNQAFGQREVRTLVVSPADAATIYAAGGENAGVASSSNGGATWFRHDEPSSVWGAAGGIQRR